MRTYDYAHESLTDGESATPGNVYTVMRTKQKLEGALDGWMATKQVNKYADGNKRLFTRIGGSVAYFGRDDMLRK